MIYDVPEADYYIDDEFESDPEFDSSMQRYVMRLEEEYFAVQEDMYCD